MTDSANYRRISATPRVVLLEDRGSTAVEIVDLPPSADTGDEFCLGGRRWTVTGSRQNTRVLVALPTLSSGDSLVHLTGRS